MCNNTQEFIYHKSEFTYKNSLIHSKAAYALDLIEESIEMSLIRQSVGLDPKARSLTVNL